MGPTAILTLGGLSAQPPLHLLLRDGRPPEVAAWLAATAACETLLPAELKAQAIGIDCTYHYRLTQQQQTAGVNRIRLECWRRYAAGKGWQRRCGPMELDQFIRRFQLPCVAQRASS